MLDLSDVVRIAAALCLCALCAYRLGASMARGSRKPVTQGDGQPWSNPWANALNADQSSSTFDWHDVEPEHLYDAVKAAVGAGKAIMLSSTSDGGAVRVAIFDGDDKFMVYTKNAVELNAILRRLAVAAD